MILRYVLRAGAGDYLEIGSAAGDSARFVHSIKSMVSNLAPGRVVCVDPKPLFDPLPGIELIVGRSPQDLPDGMFNFIFVDGDHEGEAPIADWLAVKDRSSRYVMFHDWPMRAVRLACEAARITLGWREVEKNDICFVLEKT